MHGPLNVKQIILFAFHLSFDCLGLLSVHHRSRKRNFDLKTETVCPVTKTFIFGDICEAATQSLRYSYLHVRWNCNLHCRTKRTL